MTPLVISLLVLSLILAVLGLVYVIKGPEDFTKLLNKMPLKPPEAMGFQPSWIRLILWVLALMGVGGATGWLFYRSLIMVVVLMGASICLIPWVIKMQQGQYEEKVLDEFMDLTVWLVAGLQAGKSMETVLADLGRQWRQERPLQYPLMYEEVLKWCEQLEIGKSATEIIEGFSLRIDIKIISQFSQTLKISGMHGANLIDVIHLTHRILREQRHIDKEINVLVAQKKMEQKVLSAMPLVMLYMLQTTAMDFVSPLYETWMGRGLMTLALLVFIVCYVWSARIALCTS